MRCYESKQVNAEGFIEELFNTMRGEAVCCIKNKDRAHERNDIESAKYWAGFKDAYVKVYDQIRQWIATGECTAITYYNDDAEDGVDED